MGFAEVDSRTLSGSETTLWNAARLLLVPFVVIGAQTNLGGGNMTMVDNVILSCRLNNLRCYFLDP